MRRQRLVLWICAFWMWGEAFWAQGGSSQTFPPLRIPETCGVNIHFTAGHERDLDLIRQAGFRWVRMDMTWAAIERQRGRYDWSAYDALTRDLRNRGLGALYILDYSNPLYEEIVASKDPVSGKVRKSVASPRHPESVAAFARWAAAAVRHFRGHSIIWEIWNEPNIHFWKPAPNVKEYLNLLQATVQAIRKADPEATIVAPATSGFPWGFLETLFRAGILKEIDGVTVHPYRAYHLGPETALSDYLRLRSLIDRYAPAGRRIPILCGEWGYATHQKGLPLETQAAFLVRQQLFDLWAGIPLTIWYDWKNDGPDPKEREHNFGVVRQDLQPKPAYRAFRWMTTLLGGYQIHHRLVSKNKNDWLLLCTRAGRPPVLVAWTTGQPHRVPCPFSSAAPQGVRMFDLFGRRVSPTWDKGQLILPLTPQPQYVVFRSSDPQLQAECAWFLRSPRLLSCHRGELIRLHVTNPWKETMNVKAQIVTPQGTSHASTVLPPKGQGNLTFHLRLPPIKHPLTLPLTLTFHSKACPRFRTEIHFLVAP